jgi:hypothetical protein
MIIRLFLTLYLLTSNIYLLYSQVINIDHKQITTDSTGWIGDIEFDFDFNNNASTQTENRSFLALRLISNLSYYSENHHFYFKNRLSHYRFGQNGILNAGYSHLRINFNYSKKFGYELFTQTNFDRFRNLTLRNLFGGGIRQVFIKTTSTEFEVGTGIIYEYENWKSFTSDEITTKKLFKNQSYLGYYKHFSHFGISLLNVYQTGYDREIEKFRHRLTGFLEFDDFINEHVTLVLKFEYHFDPRPIIDNKIFTYGISNAIRLNL